MRVPIVLLVCLLTPFAFADEGLWLFNQFPKEAVKQKHGFDVSDEFLDNLRLASVRIGGGSGSFVSPTGLLLTNQHLVAGCLSKLGFLKDGFYAADPSAEAPCPGLEAGVLTRIEDVTAAVKAAVKAGAPAAEAVIQRNAAIGKLEKGCADSCMVVKLYSGGRYDLYHYKKYADLRLVFAPEQELAFFGRERDSITYLRYGLDVAFLRAYENGKPAATAHFLKASSEGVKDGDLVFAAGNPGTTTRATTAAQLTFYRDMALPLTITRLRSRIQLAAALAAKAEENQRAIEPALTELIESYKAAAGKLIGLRDDRLVGRKTFFDTKIRRAVEKDPKLGTEGGKVWDQVAAAYKSWAPLEKPYQILDGSPAPGSTLFRVARELIAGRELGSDADAPVSEALEIAMLAKHLDSLKSLGEKEAPVKSILGGKTSQQAAEALVQGSRVKDSAERRRLAANHEAVSKSDDPIIRMALQLEGSARKLRKKREDLIGSLEASAAEKIAQYRFQLFGAADYPDATSTPRVEFGVVKGYTDRAKVPAPFAATFGGLYYRRNNEGPYQVPQRWVDAKAALSMVTALDFVSTCDVGGGDYGSPTVNKAGELVGLIFDGNLESLPGTYLYSEEQARAVHVAVQGIAEALEKVYKATALLRELGLGPKGVS